MFHKLLHRGLTGSFSFNSVYAMQPMYTSRDNERILKKLKTMDQFSIAQLAVPKPKIVFNSYTAVSNIVKTNSSFRSPWATLADPYVSDKAIGGFHIFQQEKQGNQIYQSVKAKNVYLDFLVEKAESLVHRATCRVGRSYNRIDIVRE